jgi:hypothetical protein
MIVNPSPPTAAGSARDTHKDGIHLPNSVITALPLEEAARDAARRGADFFPSRVGLNAAARSSTVVEALRRRLRSGYRPTTAEVVLAAKFGGGSRPAVDLGVTDRILFDALVRYIDDQLPTDLVNRTLTGDGRAKAENSLRAGPHTHVLVTDVVAFYEYLDRPRLIDELLDLTGADEAIAALDTLLAGVMGWRRGIPQASPDATVLGDVYLSIADRDLSRSGVLVTRWGDDYRIPADGLSAAYRASAALEGALRELGLVINGAKTWTPSTEKYGEWVDKQRATRRTLKAIRERIKARLAEDYAADEDAPPRRKTRVDRGLERDFLAATDENAPWGSSPEGYAASRQVQTGLQELGRTGSNAPLSRLDLVLFRYPHLTRDTSQYLRRRIVGGHVDDTVGAITDALSSESYPFPWQSGWLLHALIPVRKHIPKTAVTVAKDWLAAGASPGFIRGRAAILLATEGELPMGKELDAIWSDMPEANRVDLVGAATLMKGAEAKRFLVAVRRDPLHAAIADEAPNTSVYEL